MPPGAGSSGSPGLVVAALDKALASARAKDDTEAELGQDRPQMADPEGPVTLDDEAGAPTAVVAAQLVERKDRDGHGSEERVGAAGRLLVGVLQNAEPRH